MNRNQKTKTVVAVVGIVILSAKLVNDSRYVDLYERYPHLDPKIVRKAHRKMLIKAAHHEYFADQMRSDFSFDEAFLFEVSKLMLSSK